MDEKLESFPLTSFFAVVYILLGVFLCVTNDLTYSEYLDSTWKVLLGLGVVGAVRVADKHRKQRNGDI